MSVATIPRWTPPRARHRAKEALWRQVFGHLLMWLTLGAQTDPDATQEVARPSAPINGLQALTAQMSGLVAMMRRQGYLPPEPPKGWRGWLMRLRRWMRGWRDQDVAVARLVLVREWCKTIALMAGTATFLYVCWAVVDWIPA